jgi:cyclophilin family peptidyl-prolyl cis-trans isomerase
MRHRSFLVVKISGAVIASAAILILGLCGGSIGQSVSGAGSRPNATPLHGAVAVHLHAPCTGYKTWGVPKVAPLDTHKTYTAVVTTNKGVIRIKLLPKVAPIAVQSFVFLAQHHYFDGVRFHRVVPGFVIQGGDPTGTGQCGPGYQFNDEKVTLPYTRGTVAMANAGANTNGSQFFIVLSDHTGLQPNYTIFGQVTSGMGAVDRIAHVPLGPSPGGKVSKPRVKVYMTSVRIKVS